MERNTTAVREIGAWVRHGAENPYETALMNARGSDLSWMDVYGLPVTDAERRMAAFLAGYDGRKLALAGERIADAFLHGFVSQSRQRAGRKRVRLSYQIGQEALAREAFRALQARGLTPCVQRPGCLSRAEEPDPVPDEAALRERVEAYREAFRFHEEALRDTCGMVGLIQFGQPPRVPEPGKGQGVYAAKLADALRTLESGIIPPSTLSFCKVAFPNPLVGERFEALFEDVYRMNMRESEPYERMQQSLIDALDECRFVRVTGRGGNRTDLTVALKGLPNPERQSNFLNCGGDLNIPYGEVFTTPALQGTSGRLHVREAYLNAVPYRELELVFLDGYVVGADSADGEAYVRDHLLSPFRTLTAGEFALGTNTRAYAIAEQYGLLPRLPILWTEKMGPHLAVGDPCFARGEDAPVWNLFNGKEMTARENERTRTRGENEGVYYNRHVDITLPYGDIGALFGVTAAGETRMVVRDGRFVLPGAEGLNEGRGEPV